jgi:hypothetical protein
VKPAALIALAIFSLLLGALAARLLGLAARTRRAPELFLGFAMAFPLVGYMFGVVGTAIGRGIPARWVAEVAGTFCDLGFVATVGFVWLVFRRQERWAKALSLLLSCGFVAMPFVNHFVAWEGGVPSALVARSVLRTFCYSWAALESLRYAGLMRRRVRFGLAEPLVADRFSLWGLAHLGLALMLLFVMFGVKLHLSGAHFASIFTFLGFSIGLIAAVPFILSFFPPDRYVLYIERRYRRLEAT